MKRIKAILLGIREFRLNTTTNYSYPLIEWYDTGREMAHKFTFRHFES